MVVRCFEDGNVTHVEGAPDPLRDIEIIAIEMSLADLASLQKKHDKLAREVRANPKEAPRLAALDALIAALESGRPARAFPPDSLEAELARESFLLTAKPMLYVANIDEAQIAAPGPMTQAVFAHAAAEKSRAIAFNGKIESEFAGLSDEEVAEFRTDYGITSGGLDRLIVEAYDLLGLMTFLTTGEKETRAWPIAKGTKAPQAAGTIHSDIERGFIRAEIISYPDYVTYRTLDAIRSAGRLRSEGKEYVMQEGDVVEFRFNV
jgi:GTP-binding protein YchF